MIKNLADVFLAEKHQPTSLRPKKSFCEDASPKPSASSYLFSKKQHLLLQILTS
jgi:hypothetical protein